MAKELTIPQRLEWLLKQRGVSQNALARVAKVSPQTVANTLRHGRLPQSKTTQKWAKTLGVPGTVFTARKLTDTELMKIMNAQGTWTFAERGSKPVAKKSASKKPVAKKAVAKKPVAKKAASKKPVAKKAVAKKAVAKKPVAKKTVARKPVAKKAVVKKAVAKKAVTKKPVAKKAVVKKAVVKKAVAKKPVAKKPVVKKAMAKRPVAKKAIVKKPVATKRTTTAARKPAVTRKPAGRMGSVAHIDWNIMVSRLEKLARSTKPEVQVQAISALVALR